MIRHIRIFLNKDPAVKAFARQTLPTLKAHLAAIKAVESQLKDVAK
jgi:hypothetical protein